jgi:CheY-like chemotaxis protein
MARGGLATIETCQFTLYACNPLRLIHVNAMRFVFADTDFRQGVIHGATELPFRRRRRGVGMGIDHGFLIRNHRFLGADVLVVEDDDMVCDTLGLALAEFGFRPVCARDGESALALMRIRPILLAIIDLVPPGDMSGERLMRIARKEGIPVVLTSADHARLDAASGHDPSVVCVAKPFRLEILHASITRLLSGCGINAPA